MSKLPDANPTLTAFLVRQQRQMVRVANSSAFARSGTSVTAEDVTEVSGQMQSADFDGDLAAGDAGTMGWALNAARAAFGALFLRPGSIENDALMNPITRERIYGTANNFNLTTAYVVKLTKTLTVPAGFTSAAVYCTSRVFAINDTAGIDYLYSFVEVAGNGLTAFPLGVSASNGSGTSISANCVVLDGLTPGSTFDIKVWAGSNFATWAASTLNVADVNGIVIWTR